MPPQHGPPPIGRTKVQPRIRPAPPRPPLALAIPAVVDLAVVSAEVGYRFKRLSRVKGIPSFLRAGVAAHATGKYGVVLRSATPNPAIPVIVTNTSLGIVNSKLVKAHGGTASVGADKSDKAES